MPTATASGKLLEAILQLASHYDPTQSDASESLLQQELLTDAGLTFADLGKPDARFPADNFSQVLKRLADASNNPHIALRLAEATQPRMLGSVGFLLSTAESLHDALSSLEVYLPILFEGIELKVSHRDNNSDLTRLTLNFAEERPNVTEFFLACLLNWPRWLSGRQVPIQRVELTAAAPEDLSRYRQLFAAEVQFSADSNSILLAEHYLSLPCIDANWEVHQLHREFADALLSKTGQKSALTAQIRALIRQQLSEQGEALRRETVAQQLGMSLRTLQRKLGESGTNFQTLYDQTRQELCLQYIHRAELSFGEIAFQLGFSNQSAFQKAFKRWMGMAPSRYRQQLQLSDHNGDKARLPAATDVLPAITGTGERRDTAADTSTAGSEEHGQQQITGLAEKLDKLNPFGRKTLHYAALYGETFNLQHIAEVRREPIARLMIHLWPAEQEGLIRPLPDQQEVLEFTFSHNSIRQSLIQQIPASKQQAVHLAFGHYLLARLEKHHCPALFTLPTPGSDKQDDKRANERKTRAHLPCLQHALEHLNRACDPRKHHSVTTDARLAAIQQRLQPAAAQTGHREQQLLGLLNLQAALLSAPEDKQRAESYAGHACAYLAAAKSGDHAVAQLLYRQYRLQNTPVDTETGIAQLQALVCPDQPCAVRGLAALLLAEYHQYNDQPQSALEQLLPQLHQPLPGNDKDQLIYLLQRLEQILSLMKKQPLTEQPLQGPASDGQGSLYQDNQPLLQFAISQLSLNLGNPLLAACAISDLTLNSLQQRHQGRFSPLMRYAFSAYAWVASWYCADEALARQMLQAAEHTGGAAEKEREKPRDQERFAPVDEALNQLFQRPVLHSVNASELLICSQILHLERPLGSVLNRLKKLSERSPLQPQLLARQRLLRYQLSTLAEEISLTRLYSQAEQDYRQLKLEQPAQAEQLNSSALHLIRCLQGRSLTGKPVYRSAEQAATSIRLALLLNKQAQWPELFQWQARLENERPGSFIITESLFSLGMMRLILCQQEQRLSPRRSRLIEQTESRFQLWTDQCPANHAGQLALLQAEKARLQLQLPSADAPEQAPEAGFEQAISIFRQQGLHSYQALAWERYSYWLQANRQPLLAEMSLQKAKNLYRHWGATAKAESLSL